MADVRIVAASNASLRQLAASGGFRSDLLYRLNALYVRIAPLRERSDDIAPLACHFLVAAAQQLGTTDKRWTRAALDVLTAYAWPGNVRELENVALRACLAARSEEVGIDELAAVDAAFCTDAGAEVTLKASANCADTYRAAKNRAIASFDRSFLTDLLRRTGGNVTTAAKLGPVSNAGSWASC